MQSFHQFPKGTKYVYGLNFNDGESGLLQTVLEARYAFGAIQDDLYAFEIGNEVDGTFPKSRQNYLLIFFEGFPALATVLATGQFLATSNSGSSMLLPSPVRISVPGLIRKSNPCSKAATLRHLVDWAIMRHHTGMLRAHCDLELPRREKLKRLLTTTYVFTQ